MTDRTEPPWESINRYGTPLRYRRLPDWEVHHVNDTPERWHFELRNTATGLVEGLPSSHGLNYAADHAEIRIAEHTGDTGHLSSYALAALDDRERKADEA
ncbi:hypothetical protein [Micromonospora carbonacea]|uniref:hypothetical protein n=1 Tax=Micromonospora carbonacea TaxID=47853 RepID=UPI003715209C